MCTDELELEPDILVASACKMAAEQAYPVENPGGRSLLSMAGASVLGTQVSV